MKALCHVCATSLLVTALAGCHRAKPSPVASPLVAMQKVMAQAKSCRVTTVSHLGETVSEIEVPDKERVISKASGNTTETIQAGDFLYIKSGDKWMKSPVANAAAHLDCSLNESAGSGADAAPLSAVKGKTQNINGVACQEWTIGPEPSSTTYCIGSDSYPVQMKSSASTTTYSDWNKVQVEIPKV